MGQSRGEWTDAPAPGFVWPVGGPARASAHGGGSAVAVGTAHGFSGVSLIDDDVEPESPRAARPAVIWRIRLDPADGRPYMPEAFPFG